jgi:hypothetical protein
VHVRLPISKFGGALAEVGEEIVISNVLLRPRRRGGTGGRCRGGGATSGGQCGCEAWRLQLGTQGVASGGTAWGNHGGVASHQRRFNLLLAGRDLPRGGSLHLLPRRLFTLQLYLLLCHSYPNFYELLLAPQCEVLPGLVEECFQHWHGENVKGRLVFKNLYFRSIGARQLGADPSLGPRYVLSMDLLPLLVLCRWASSSSSVWLFVGALGALVSTGLARLSSSIHISLPFFTV